MKKILTITIILIITLGILTVAKDGIIKTIVAAAVEKAVGAKTTIGSFSLSLSAHTAQIKNFKIHNPPGFPKGLLLDLPYAKVDVNVPALFKKELHLRELSIELRELDLVKNKEGRLNVDVLSIDRSREKKPAGAGPSAKKEAVPLRIDILNLNIGKIVSKDYASAEPAVKVYDLNINKTYKNITSLNQLTLLILTEPMKSAGIKGAKIYGLAALTGAGFIPIAAGTVLLGKDSSQEIFDFTFDKAYDAALGVLAKSGKIKNANRETGTINASLNGAEITAVIINDGGKSRVRVSARKYFLPKPDIANSVLYRIKEELTHR